MPHAAAVMTSRTRWDHRVYNVTVGDSDELIAWIRAGLDRPGKSQAGLAKALQRSPSVVTAIMSGMRDVKAKEIATIARYFGIRPPLSVLERVPQGAVELSRPMAPWMQSLTIKGEVQAGTWREPRSFTETAQDTLFGHSGTFPPDSAYVLRIRGTSVNRVAQDGDFAVCVDKFAFPRPFRDGDWVVAERTDTGGKIETTIKRVSRHDNGESILLPYSTDPAWQDPVILGEGYTETVEVKAFVVQFVKPATML